MEAQFVEDGEIVIVRLKGHFDFESVDSFNQTCEKYLQNQKVIFNLERLNFVGSSGLDSFMETLKKIKSTSFLRMCHVSNEFRLVFDSCYLKNLEIYENENLAKNSF